MNSLKKTIAVALDQMTPTEALQFIKETKHQLGFYKIGLELFYSGGKDFIREVSDENVRLFLDLKLHDIPTTVAKSIHSLKDLDIDFLTLHLTGGPAMLKAAICAQEEYMPKTKLLGVSFLTSFSHDEMDKVFNLGDSQKRDKAFQNLFEMACTEKIHGVVHSGQELKMACQYPFISVCPGIRFLEEIANSKLEDQKRVLDPKTALSFSTTNKEVILVIGRSLTKTCQQERNEKIRYLQGLQVPV